MEVIAKGFFDIVFNLINVFIDAIFLPVNTLLPSIFDGIVLSDYVTNFYGIINQYIIPSAAFFANIVPPLSWSLIIIYFTLMISLYSVVFTLHFILKPLKVVKTIIPFT